MRLNKIINIKVSFTIGIGFVLILFFSACTDMDHTYHEFWEEGEKVYPAFPDSLTLFPGRERVMLKWLNKGGNDIEKTVFYWNNKSDSVEVFIEKEEEVGNDTLQTIIDDLPEGNYSFQAQTFDKEGNKSVVNDVSGETYGENYENSLLNRIIKEVNYSDGEATIEFGDPADETSIGAEIKYQSINNKTKVVHVPPNEETVILDDFDFNARDSLAYRTLYKPDSMAIDKFNTKYEKTVVLGARKLLSRAGWSIEASDYDDREGMDRGPEKVLDGNEDTEWANQINVSDYPHELSINMGEKKDGISGVALFINEAEESPKTMNVFVKDTEQEDWTLIEAFGVENVSGRQFFDFAEPQSFRHFKLEFTEGYGSPNLLIYEVDAFKR